MNVKILLFSFFIVTSLFAQNELDTNAIKYSKTVTAEELKEHLSVISSDLFEGRETGKKGQKLAAEYIGNAYKKLKIPVLSTGGYYQKFPLIEQNTDSAFMKIGGKQFNWITDFYALPGLIKMKGIKSEVVFVGYGIEDDERNDYQELDVKGKIVLFFKGVPDGISTSWQNEQKIEKAIEKGAVAVLIIDKKFEDKLDKIKHRAKRKKMKIAEESAYQSIPAFYINVSSSEYLLGKKIEKIEKGMAKKSNHSFSITKEVEITIHNTTEVISSENVLGFIEGNDNKEEIVVITAHYDHLGKRGDKIYNGADDDGTGTAALLEIAQAFVQAKSDGIAIKRSILIMAVSGEEKGLLGSRYYTDNPVFPLENTMVNLNVDMIGRHDKSHEEKQSYIYLIGADKLSKDLHETSELTNQLYSQLDLDYTYNDENDPNRYYYRSDHYNFVRHNVPAIFYFSGVHEDYHKPTDTADKINFELLEKRSRLIFHTAWKLATRDQKLLLNNP